MTGKLNLLVVEDDSNLSFLLRKNLEEEGYNIIVAADGEEGWNQFNEHGIDLCILDIMLPKQDGFSLAQMIRGKNSKVPILFLTARKMMDDIYQGFESGGDDYLTKPFTAKELLYRIKAILRRTTKPVPGGVNNAVYNIGKCQFNHTLRSLSCGATVKRLSTKENELLRILCEGMGTVVNRSRLLVEVWGRDDYFVSKSLDVYITRLRKLFCDNPEVTIQNYHSFGYKMVIKDTAVG